MTRTRLRAAALLPALLAVLALGAACGGDDDSGGEDARTGGDSTSAATGSGDPTGSGDAGDFASQPGDAIADAAKADMAALEAVHYAGSIDSDGQPLELDVRADRDGDCTGSVSVGDGTAELLGAGGENWFRPDEAFWRQESPDQADQIISAVGDRWILDSDDNFSQFCDIDAFFDNIFDSSEGTSSYEVTGTDQVDGQDVVLVTSTDDGGSSTGYVLVDSPHYLLEIERTEGDQPGRLGFSEFGTDVTAEAPAADQVVDLNDLG